MDRSIVYPGAAAQDVDLLFPQRAVMQTLGYLLFTMMGTGTSISALNVTPTSPGSLAVQVSNGALINNDIVDPSAYGSLGADTTHMYPKIAINPDPVATTAMVAPTAAGQQQKFLIACAPSEYDTAPIGLPFWNAANPSQPYLGQANNGGLVNTQRVRRIAVQVKAGTAAASGAAVAPSPDSGWTPLAIVTLATGQTSIGMGDIAAYVPSARLPFLLPQLTPGFSRRVILTSTSGATGGNTGVFTVPDGVTLLNVTYTGGGGGGSACQASGTGTAISGGSGGAGATQFALASVTPGQAIAWTVGLGGISQSAGGATVFGGLQSAAPGGASKFSNASGTEISAGGAGGTAVGTGVAGGDGTDGQNGSLVSISGAGGTSHWGGGGRAAAQGGQPGRAWGAGGGGSNDPNNTNTNFAGGAGAPGVIIVEY